MWIPVYDPIIPKSCTLGTSQEETIAVVSPNPLSITPRWLTMLSASAASSMYLRARKLRDLMSDPSLFSAFALDQLEAYTVAINALSLIEEESAWISLPIQTEYPTEVGIPSILQDGSP